MARPINKPQIVVNSFYGKRDNSRVLSDYVRSIINRNEILKSSFDTIAIGELTEYNALKNERRKKYGITA